MDNYSTSQRSIQHRQPTHLRYPDPIKVSSTFQSPSDIISNKSNMIPTKDGIPDQVSDLASFSPDEADSMIQSAAGRSPLPSPPRRCASISTLHQLSLKPLPRASTPDEIIDPNEWDHLSYSTQSSPERNSSQPTPDYDLNHSPDLLSQSPQPDRLYPSSSPTPSYMNLTSNKSSVSNLHFSKRHLQEWQKSLPESEVVPPEATISELLGVSTRIEKRLSIEDDRQSLQNDLAGSSELRPGDSWSQSTSNSIPKETSNMPPEMASDNPSSPPRSNSDQGLDPSMDLSASYLLPEMQSIADASKHQIEVFSEDPHLISQLEDASIHQDQAKPISEHGSQFPLPDSQEIYRSSKELDKEETREIQNELLQEEISDSDTMSHLQNRLTYSHLAILGGITCSASAIIHAWTMSNEGQVPDEVEQPNLEVPITDTDSPIVDNGARVKVSSDVEDSVVINRPVETLQTEGELLRTEPRIDTLQDQPLISNVQDTVPESSSVSIDSEIECLKIEEPIFTPIQEIATIETLQSEMMKSNQEKKIDPPSPSTSSSSFSYFDISFGILNFLMIFFIFWKFKSNVFKKFNFLSQTQKSRKLMKEEEFNEIENKPEIQLDLTDDQIEQIEFNLGKVFGILDGIWIPQDTSTLVLNLKAILNNSWMIRPFYAGLINRLSFQSNQNQSRSKVDKLIIIKLIGLLKQKKLIKEDFKGKKKEEEDKEEEEENISKSNCEQMLLWEAIKELEEETENETKPEIKVKEGRRKSIRRSKTPEIKVKEEVIREEIVSETETILPPSKSKPQRLKSNKRNSSKNPEEINEENVKCVRRRLSNRIKSEPIEEPQLDSTQNMMVNKKSNRKSQVGINNSPTAIAVPVRSSPRIKKN